MALEVQHFFDSRTSSLSYVVFDSDTRTGVVIDPVLDFEPTNARISEAATVKPIFDFIEARELRIPFVLDTHFHADHLTAAARIKLRCGSRTVIGSNVVDVQKTFAEWFNLTGEFVPDGSQFDVLMDHGEELDVGPFSIKAHHSPGHTPACSTWQINHMIFVGDVLFMPDFGTARCDFPGGSAAALYNSIQQLYQLPGETEVYTCHDYQPGGRDLRFRSTIEAQRTRNTQLTMETTRDQFVAFREKRDATLALPNLMLAALQVNIRAGELPPPEANGNSYLKIPLNVF